jgi:hypothetical protein
VYWGYGTQPSPGASTPQKVFFRRNLNQNPVQETMNGLYAAEHMRIMMIYIGNCEWIIVIQDFRAHHLQM